MLNHFFPGKKWPCLQTLMLPYKFRELGAMEWYLDTLSSRHFFFMPPRLFLLYNFILAYVVSETECISSHVKIEGPVAI